uniref:LDLR chaperone boca n=1 Tax=Meloidogyne incognita TaxID=6306 RepID=A0A914L9A7_MELIC
MLSFFNRTDSKLSIFLLIILIILLVLQLSCSKKDVRDYTEAELDKLYEQWAENDSEDDAEQENKPKTANSPDDLLKMTKKGQSVMMFVSVANPVDNSKSTKEFTEKISAQWQQSFFNNHIDAQNYVVDDDRILFLFKEGQQAWDARDFLIRQPECKEIQLEGRTIPGPASSVYDTKINNPDEF